MNSMHYYRAVELLLKNKINSTFTPFTLHSDARGATTLSSYSEDTATVAVDIRNKSSGFKKNGLAWTRSPYVTKLDHFCATGRIDLAVQQRETCLVRGKETRRHSEIESKEMQKDAGKRVCAKENYFKRICYFKRNPTPRNALCFTMRYLSRNEGA